MLVVVNIIIDRISTCNGWFVAQQTVRDEVRSLGKVNDSALLSVVVEAFKVSTLVQYIVVIIITLCI